MINDTEGMCNKNEVAYKQTCYQNLGQCSPGTISYRCTSSP